MSVLIKKFLSKILISSFLYRFIIHIENIMWDIDSRLLFYHNCLRRLQKHLNIIEQIHQAPTVYVTAVNEVVRRKEFSSAFLLVSPNFNSI